MSLEKPIRMAILDDSQDAIFVFTRSVEKYNDDPKTDPKIELATFTHSSDFLQAYGHNPFDCVLLDIELGPGDISGISVYEAIQKTHPMRSVVLLETAMLRIPQDEDSWLAKSKLNADIVMERFFRLRNDLAMNVLECCVRMAELDLLVGSGADR